MKKDTIQLKRDCLYDIGGKVLSLAEIQQAVIDQDCYHKTLEIIGGK
jgi:hypothetical protein